MTTNGLNIGQRHITLSTVGLVPAIRRFADEKLQVGLAISLHAATDEERDKLLPVNKRWPLADLLDAMRYYIDQTGRRVTFEWALIAGENDTVQQAEKLGQLLQGIKCHVNLIPLNPTPGYGGQPSDPARVADVPGGAGELTTSAARCVSGAGSIFRRAAVSSKRR